MIEVFFLVVMTSNGTTYIPKSQLVREYYSLGECNEAIKRYEPFVKNGEYVRCSDYWRRRDTTKDP